MFAGDIDALRVGGDDDIHAYGGDDTIDEEHRSTRDVITGHGVHRRPEQSDGLLLRRTWDLVRGDDGSGQKHEKKEDQGAHQLVSPSASTAWINRLRSVSTC